MGLNHNASGEPHGCFEQNVLQTTYQTSLCEISQGIGKFPSGGSNKRPFVPFPPPPGPGCAGFAPLCPNGFEWFGPAPHHHAALPHRACLILILQRTFVTVAGGNHLLAPDYQFPFAAKGWQRSLFSLKLVSNGSDEVPALFQNKDCYIYMSYAPQPRAGCVDVKTI